MKEEPKVETKAEPKKEQPASALPKTGGIVQKSLYALGFVLIAGVGCTMYLQHKKIIKNIPFKYNQKRVCLFFKNEYIRNSTSTYSKVAK